MVENKKIYTVVTAISLTSITCTLPVCALGSMHLSRGLGNFKGIGSHGNNLGHNPFNAGQQFGNHIGRNFDGQSGMFAGANRQWNGQNGMFSGANRPRNGQGYGGAQTLAGRWNGDQQFFGQHPNPYRYQMSQNFGGQQSAFRGGGQMNGGRRWDRPYQPGYQISQNYNGSRQWTNPTGHTFPLANGTQFNGSQQWSNLAGPRFLGHHNNYQQAQNNLNGNTILSGQNRSNHLPQMANAKPNGTYFNTQQQVN